MIQTFIIAILMICFYHCDRFLNTCYYCFDYLISFVAYYCFLLLIFFVLELQLSRASPFPFPSVAGLQRPLVGVP